MCTEIARKEQPVIRLWHMSGGPNGCLGQPIPRFAETKGKFILETWQYKDDQFWALEDQSEALPTQISNLCCHKRNGSKNPLAKC